MTITIKTHLDAGIYRSSGGGETRTHYEWATGPRNLLKAVARYYEHRRDMERGYGNIGCGRSWLEIDGQRIDPLDLPDLLVNDREIDMQSPQSQTDKARHMIASAKSGQYARGLADAAKLAAYYDADDAIQRGRGQ